MGKKKAVVQNSAEQELNELLKPETVQNNTVQIEGSQVPTEQIPSIEEAIHEATVAELKKQVKVVEVQPDPAVKTEDDIPQVKEVNLKVEKNGKEEEVKLSPDQFKSIIEEKPKTTPKTTTLSVADLVRIALGK